MSHGHNNLLSTMSSYQAFRVRGLPSVFNAEAIAVLLQSVLGCEADSLTVNSLGLDPYSEESVSQVATITLGRLPKCLEDRKNDWPLTVKAKNPADNLDICFSVTLDTHFMGFTPLNAAKDYCDYAIDCIAITGLGSHPFGSWKQRSGQHMWLRDSLPQDLNGVRILLYGYDTNLADSQTFQSIDDIAATFKQGIRNESLLAPIKAILQMKSGDEIDKRNFNSIYGIIFFGVPNQGIKIEQWIPMVQGQPNENLIRDLGFDSTYLRRLHDTFRATFYFPDSVIVSIYETERTRMPREEQPGRWTRTGDLETLVPVISATDSLFIGPRYYEWPIKQNHSDMVKFSNYHDENYRLISAQLQQFCLEAVGVVQSRFFRDRVRNMEPTDSEGWTQLHLAVFHGHNDSIVQLIDTNDCETPDTKGRTPLYIAAYYGQSVPARFLLDKGANKDTKNIREESALYAAASRGHERIVALLLDRGSIIDARDASGKGPLYAAARNAHPAIVRLLIERGADTEAKAIGGYTPLHVATWFGHETTVMLLLDKRADKEATDDFGRTPLHIATLHGHEEVAALLLRMGARTEAEDSRRCTPLHIAAHCGRDEIARQLVAKGAEKEARNDEKMTPLYVATREGNERMIKLLVQNGANLEAKKEGIWSPLHAAAWYGHGSALKVLVENGADIEIRNDKGETPLFVAARRGHEAAVRLLVDRGANISAKTKDKWTPRKAAERNGHKGVVILLDHLKT
ncbi:MAG: hypothetical protein M1813_005463 [Trichoglossum hirsutum]|nr:MAG: hypothetical protein M1813_005463 [Trichoglossum hirsutum]